jgi:nickel superoxide dismutase
MHLTSRLLTLLDRMSSPATVHAHCDLPCGVYDPAQARIEAESVKAIMEKFNASTDEVFKTRAILIKEERADLVKHHLWVLWTDYFKPEHLAKYPELHTLFWTATKTAGEAKKTTDVAVGQKLLDQIGRPRRAERHSARRLRGFSRLTLQTPEAGPPPRRCRLPASPGWPARHSARPH